MMEFLVFSESYFFFLTCLRTALLASGRTSDRANLVMVMVIYSALVRSHQSTSLTLTFSAMYNAPE